MQAGRAFPDQIPPWRLQEQHGCQVVLSEGLSPRHRHGALGAGMTPAVLSRLLLNTVRECGSAGGAQSEEILCCPGGSPAAPAWPSSVPVEVQVGYQRKSLLPKSSQHRAAAQEVLGSPSLGCSEPWGCGTVGWVGIGLGDRRPLFQDDSVVLRGRGEVAGARCTRCHLRLGEFSAFEGLLLEHLRICRQLSD